MAKPEWWSDEGLKALSARVVRAAPDFATAHQMRAIVLRGRSSARAAGPCSAAELREAAAHLERAGAVPCFGAESRARRLRDPVSHPSHAAVMLVVLVIDSARKPRGKFPPYPPRRLAPGGAVPTNCPRSAALAGALPLLVSCLHSHASHVRLGPRPSRRAGP